MKKGELSKVDGVWVIKHYTEKEKNRSDFTSTMEFFSENYERKFVYLKIYKTSLKEYKSYFKMVEKMGSNPTVTYTTVVDFSDKFCLIHLNEDDLFDYTNADYQLGIYVGEFIVGLHLPTLNIDSLKTNKIVEVSNEEFQEYKKLYDIWECQNHEENWKVVRDYTKKLGEKYLPKKLEINVPKFYPNDLSLLKKGVERSIWDCDRSWYWVEDDFFTQTLYGAWCSKITLYLNFK